jgi:alginate O-acetyltransferase complex protein AlgI
LIIIFIVIKYPWLTEKAARLLRVANHQDANLASLNDLQWLGFSYLAFRLLHVLRDHQIQKSQGQKLSDLLSYALFLPAYVAGPIDRSQRFIADLSSPQNVSKPKNRDVDITEGVKRIIVGLFSKFVLADSFALLALNPINALEIRSTFWSWVALYGYTLRIFFDFSGYTDIAIGAGKLLGITLPENFDSPYKKTSLIAFWNSWHITLAQWFRAYFFNPLTRAMRMKKNVFPLWSIIFLGQVTTMLLIGLWHGITWNFAIWGLWHGFGLFVNNRWGDWFRVHGQEINISHNKELILKFSGWLLTFHFVTLGWVWFVIPDPLLALKIFQHLVGIYR